MKEMKAFIRAERADEVLGALADAGVSNVTLTHVYAVGPNVDPDDSRVSMEFGRKMTTMVKLELIFLDKEEAKLLGILREAACSGRPGDGIMAVYNVNRLVKIRSGEESIEAL